MGSLDSKESVESLGPVESSVGYAGGYLFLVRAGHMSGGNLTTWAFDPDCRRLIGAPVALGLPASVDPVNQVRQGFPSRQRRIALVDSPRGPLFDLTWRNRDGQRVGTIGEPGRYIHVDLSPDDSTVAMARQSQDPGKPLQLDIWTIDVTPGGISKRVTDDPAFEVDPAWSGDGRTAGVQLEPAGTPPREDWLVRSSAEWGRRGYHHQGGQGGADVRLPIGPWTTSTSSLPTVTICGPWR